MEKELRDRFLFFQRALKISEATYFKNPTDADNLIRWGGALLQLSQFQAFSTSKNMLLGAISKFQDALVVNPKKHDSLWCMGNAYTSLAFLVPDQDEAKDYFVNAAHFFQLALDEDPSNDLYRKSLQVAAKAPQLHSEIHNQGGFPQQTMAFRPSSFTKDLTRCGGGLDQDLTRCGGGLDQDLTRCGGGLDQDLTRCGGGLDQDLTRCGGGLDHLSLFPDFPEFIGVAFERIPFLPDEDPSLNPELTEVILEIHNEGGFPQQTMASGPSSSTSTKNPKKKKNNDLKYDKLGWVILAVGIVASVGSWISHVPPPPPR